MVAFKWGIVGAGRIAQDFVNSIGIHSPEEKKLICAVAAKDITRAQEFSEKHGISQAYGSYQELADDPNIDIVYINNLSNHHYEVCMQMLKAGKHVLCEKPLTMDVQQTKEVLAFAKQQQRFLMEAAWSRFLPAYEKLRDELSRNTIGDVLLVDAKFCLDMAHVPRIIDPDLGGSIIFDIGIYAIQLATLVLGNRPKRIHCAGCSFPNGVDNISNITLIYENDAVARLFCSGTYQIENSARICGTEGKIEIPDPFYTPEVLITPSGTHQYPIPEPEHNFNFLHRINLYYEFKATNDAIEKGLLEHPLMTHEDSLALVEIIAECIRQCKSVS